VIAALRAWWLGLAQRERRMTAGAVAFVSLALLYVVAIEPAWKSRARLDAELPRLREQSREIEALAKEAKSLGQRGVAVTSASAARGLLEQSLARAHLGPAEIVLADERRLTVSLKNVPAGQWLAWIEETARESRMRIAAARFAKTPQRGRVDATVTFEIATPR
jgi:general secretion pathway protein M